MIAVNIPDIKIFMNSMFSGELFDSFLLTECEVNTAICYKLSGRLNLSFFTDEELEEMRAEEFVGWRDIKATVMQLIKGHKTPLSMKLVFLLPDGPKEKLIAQAGMAYRPEEIKGLYINIRYEKNILSLITGTSMNTFTMDKTIDAVWDESIKRFLQKKEIAYEKME